MADVVVQVKTNKEFLEAILTTKAATAVEARSLLRDFFTFKTWSQFPATNESIESVAEVFSARVHTSLKSLRNFNDLYQEKLKNVQEFLRMLRRIAFSDFGAEINLNEAHSILSQP